MSIEAALLHALSDGSTHSGAELARRFGVTRAAVWKRVARMRAQGLMIDAVAGTGYRMSQPWSALDRDCILQRLQPDARRLLGSLTLVATTGSTNHDLHAAAGTLPDLTILVAEHQTQGRGRRGRAWLSPLGAGLWFSILARHDAGVGAMAGLSLAVAVLVAEALERVGVPGIELKWPNDVWYERRKLGGILIELAGDWHGPSTAVIGIGINIALPPASHAQIGQPATDLAQALGVVPDRNYVLAALIDTLLPGLTQFRQQGFRAFHDRWDARDALRGRDVIVEGAAVVAGIAGIADGIDQEGRLQLLTPRGAISIGAGEISVRTDAIVASDMATRDVD